jgi:Domain of unknown function (DUF834).
MMSSPAARTPKIAGDLGHDGTNGGHHYDKHDARNSPMGGATTNDDGRQPATNFQRRRLRLDGVGGAPAVFGCNEGMDGVQLPP